MGFDFDDKRKIFKLEIQTPHEFSPIYFLDGQEIKGADGDINIICPGKRISHEPRTRNVEDLAKEAKDLGALVSLPHAFGKDGLAIIAGQEKVEKLIKSRAFDFIEVYDALMDNFANRNTITWFGLIKSKAREGYFDLANLPQEISVSDGHYNNDVGKAFTYLNLPRTMPVYDVFNILKSAKVLPLEDVNFGKISLSNKARYSASLLVSIIKDKLQRKNH